MDLLRSYLFQGGRAVKAVIPDASDRTRKVVALNPAATSSGCCCLTCKRCSPAAHIPLPTLVALEKSDSWYIRSMKTCLRTRVLHVVVMWRSAEDLAGLPDSVREAVQGVLSGCGGV
jgi:hypothetical protein